uniref:Uncharacterized protein n=1 Tax=Setaria italica TaxID=4555 RepID=K4ALT8_SETIT
MAAAARVAGVPSVRLASRLQIAISFFPSSTRRAGRRVGSAAGPPPALTADVRVVIRRHFPAVGPLGTRIVVQKVSEDIALRRRPSRKLSEPDRVERALAQDVIPLVGHPFDRGAVVAASREICARVAVACADPRVAGAGVRVLVIVDTFACPVPAMWSGAVKNAIARADDPCKEPESGLPEAAAKEQPRPVGVIGDTRPKPVEERFEGWLPW